MTNLFNYLSNQAVNIYEIWSDTSILIAALFFVLTCVLYFYSKDLRYTINELKETNSDLGATIKSDINIIDRKNSALQLLNEKVQDKTKAFEDAVAEIKELRAKNKFLESCNTDNLERINKLQSQIKHTKYVRLNKQYKPEKYICTKSSVEFFIEGNEYNRSYKYKDHFGMTGENGLAYIVPVKNFKAI